MKLIFPLLCIVLFIVISTSSAEEDEESEEVSTERAPRGLLRLLGSLLRGSARRSRVRGRRPSNRRRVPPRRRPAPRRSRIRGRRPSNRRRVPPRRRPAPSRRCPTVTFPCSRIPHVCANMRRAFDLRKPRILRRTTDASRIRNNRLHSGCRELYPRPAGYNCDEYPFASSYEGGRGATVELVPARENSIQGAILSIFYRINNIGNGDCYTVALQN